MTYPAVHAQILTLLADAEADPLQLIGAAGPILLSRDEYVQSGYLAERHFIGGLGVDFRVVTNADELP